MADTTLPGLLDTGNHAARPAASAVGSGALYSCTDHSLIYQSDGSSWTTWATLGAASVVASGAGAYNNANLALSTSGEAAVTMNAETHDTDAYHDTSSNTSRLTVPSGKGGLFVWTVNLRLSANVSTYLAVRKNGSAGTILGITTTTVTNTSISTTMGLSGACVLVATDYIEMYAVAASAVNALASFGTGNGPWFTITRIGS